MTKREDETKIEKRLGARRPMCHVFPQTGLKQKEFIDRLKAYFAIEFDIINDADDMKEEGNADNQDLNVQKSESQSPFHTPFKETPSISHRSDIMVFLDIFSSLTEDIRNLIIMLKIYKPKQQTYSRKIKNLR